MRLSELKTSQSVNVLIQLSRIISTITSDPELIDPIGQAIDVRELNLNDRGVQAKKIEQWTTFFWRLLDRHADDFYCILATINGCDAETIKNQSLMTTRKQVEELVNDADFWGFFSSVKLPKKKI